MKYLMIFFTVLMLGGCTMQEGELPKPTEMPTINPSAIPSIIPSMTPSATETPVALGVYITKILDTDPDRVINLKICQKTLDGQKIEPGEEFSFNERVGERTREKGYREAAILVEGKREEAVGGGLCQISSTIYGAARDAGMEILERHNHTGEVYYVQIGEDAAVSFGQQDFRFKNTKPYPVRISVSVENFQVEAEILKA